MTVPKTGRVGDASSRWARHTTDVEAIVRAHRCGVCGGLVCRCMVVTGTVNYDGKYAVTGESAGAERRGEDVHGGWRERTEARPAGGSPEGCAPATQNDRPAGENPAPATSLPLPPWKELRDGDVLEGLTDERVTLVPGAPDPSYARYGESLAGIEFLVLASAYRHGYWRLIKRGPMPEWERCSCHAYEFESPHGYRQVREHDDGCPMFVGPTDVVPPSEPPASPPVFREGEWVKVSDGAKAASPVGRTLRASTVAGQVRRLVARAASGVPVWEVDDDDGTFVHECDLTPAPLAGDGGWVVGDRLLHLNSADTITVSEIKTDLGRVCGYDEDGAYWSFPLPLDEDDVLRLPRKTEAPS